MSASCEKNIFFHRTLLREKINFLCFEKCRNFDFFPPHKLRNFFLLKISTCGFWQFPPPYFKRGGEYQVVTIFRPKTVRSHNLLAIGAMEMKILWKIRASDVLFEKKFFFNKCCFFGRYGREFRQLFFQGRKWAPHIFTFWVLNRSFLGKKYAFFSQNTFWPILPPKKIWRSGDLFWRF